MCRQCLIEDGGEDIKYPANDLGLRGMVNMLYASHGMGGGHHVVIDDANVEDEHLRCYVDWFEGGWHEECLYAPAVCFDLHERIADALEAFDVPTRARIVYEIPDR